MLEQSRGETAEAPVLALLDTGCMQRHLRKASSQGYFIDPYDILDIFCSGRLQNN
jgi:hypothetical protein